MAIIVVVGRYLWRGRVGTLRPKAILLALGGIFVALTVFGELLYVTDLTK